MASIEKRLAENVPGDFYVDDSCIDCDTCRWIAPDVFARSDAAEMSYVGSQPADSRDAERARMALVACPTSSIGTLGPALARAAARAFPEPVVDNVSYCGYTSASSFGASSYLIQRTQGNVLVDSPRAAAPLLRRIRDLGGVDRMLLTHRDDIADHARFRAEFGCERLIHGKEVSRATSGIERQLDIDRPTPLDDDLLAIPVPGHTAGSLAYLYRDKVLFTGDHLWWSPNVDGLHASPRVCWYDWGLQIRSMERLLEFDFEWVLPGHGRRYHASSSAAMRAELKRLVARMQG